MCQNRWCCRGYFSGALKTGKVPGPRQHEGCDTGLWPGIILLMTDTTTPAHLTGLTAAEQIARILLVGRIAARLGSFPYGYSDADALATARQMVTTRTAGQISVFLGEVEGCSNCGSPATRNGRCVRCQHLPSDYA